MATKRKRASTKVENSGSASKATRNSKAGVAAAENEPIDVVEDSENESTARFLDEPIADAEARRTWPERYSEIEVSQIWTNLLYFDFFLFLLNFAWVWNNVILRV